jgi:hypothetical protein
MLQRQTNKFELADEWAVPCANGSGGNSHVADWHLQCASKVNL